MSEFDAKPAKFRDFVSGVRHQWRCDPSGIVKYILNCYNENNIAVIIGYYQKMW